MKIGIVCMSYIFGPIVPMLKRGANISGGRGLRVEKKVSNMLLKF